MKFFKSIRRFLCCGGCPQEEEDEIITNLILEASPIDYNNNDDLFIIGYSDSEDSSSDVLDYDYL